MGIEVIDLYAGYRREEVILYLEEEHSDPGRRSYTWP